MPSRTLSFYTLGLCLSGITWGLTGRVVDKAMMLPVPDATVQLVGGASVKTDTAGRFEINTTSLNSARNKSPVWQGQKTGFVLPPNLTSKYVNLSVTSVKGAVLFQRLWHRPLPEIIAVPAQVLQSEILVFATISWEGDSQHFQITRQGLTGSWNAQIPSALSKSSAAGSLTVTKEKLMAKTVSVADTQTNVGDIVLEYPERKLDVGATPPYGAIVYFDGTKGKAAAMAEIKAKWQDWNPKTAPDLSLYTKTKDQFKIAKDPLFAQDTNRVTLQSCCDTIWGYDDIQTKDTHGDAQIHVEFIAMGVYDDVENANANDAFAAGQPGYVNSGVYIQSRYEVQIYSSRKDTAYIPLNNDDGNHNQMAALVGDFAPSANPNRANGVWQAFDITFRSARYNTSGTKTENGRISLWWNGKLVHNNRDAKAPATGTGKDTHSGEEMNATLYGLKLQSEGRDVRFRNIWIKPLKIDQAQTNFGY
jgi:hypothetical protein